jgi:hypothetical protein
LRHAYSILRDLPPHQRYTFVHYRSHKTTMNTPGRWIYGCLAALPLALVQVQAQPQTHAAPFDLTTLDRDMAGPRAQVLVLGTSHLSRMPKSFDPKSLDGLMTRLAAFRPEIITIEQEPGDECDMAARQVAKYGADFCEPADAARKATGLDIPAALADIDTTLKAWPAQPAPAQRRRLAALFLAADDRASAWTQWLQLPEAERHAGDGVDAALLQQFGKIGAARDETLLIAARLAARLGLPRVYPVDNHSGDKMDVPDIKAFVRVLEADWKAGGAALEAQEKELEPLEHGADMLPLYRALNDPARLAVRADGNVRTAMRGASPEHYSQMWVAGWETRNLRIVANIRETFRERPGARVLAIIGATHKPWLDAWLGQLQGVDIVDAEAVLK